MHVLNLFFISLLFVFSSCNKDQDTIYEGSLSIESEEDFVTYANLLEGKTEITGDVSIMGLQNPDLSIFNNIRKIGQGLIIEQCEIFDLSAFSNLEEVRFFWFIFNQISSLNGFENISSVEGIQIELNSPSLNIDAIQNINVTSFFILEGISSSIPIFLNITEVEGINLTNLSGITDYSFLPNLTNSTSRLLIGGSENVITLDGLENLTTIEKLTVIEHENLVDISSLENIESGSEINFEMNDDLSDFCPLKTPLTGSNISFSATGNLENPTVSEIITGCL